MTRAELQPLVDLDKKTLRSGGNTDPGHLARLRGIVFGRHGRVFREAELQKYLEREKWYRKNPKFTNSSLNATERENLDTIRGAESDAHERIRPGDLRFWMNRRIDFEEARSYTITDLRIMQAEIEAIHGKTFPTQPALQRYFDDRYWYKPDPQYDSKRLNPIERANLTGLQKEERSNSTQDFTPADVIRYDKSAIPAKLLEGMSLYELRLTRNALYAMHGYKFRTPWLQEYFSSVEWYQPNSVHQDVSLTSNDQDNLRRILAIEKRRHDELSTKPIAEETITGLFIEDLRKLMNEIPARHGKPFTDAGLKSYFGSLPWYKPDPKYSDQRLNPVEKKNMAMLRDALKRTTTQFNFAEG